MEPSRRNKFDAVKSAKSTLPSYMFSHVSEVVSWKDMETPAPSYPDNYTEWKETAEDDITDLMAANEGVVNSAEKQSFEIGKQITFRALEKFVAKATAVGWSSQPAELRRQQAEELLARPQIPQRTQAWYAQGKEVLTASEFSKLLGSPRSVSQLVMSKVASQTPHQTNRLACITYEMGPFDWGIRFEPVVKQILTEKWGLKIAEAGRIVHPIDPHVAASPDGIIMEASDPARVGRLLEIKCPITRKIGEGVPFDYWCQMQVQMEVTGVDECEYVEVKLDSAQGTSMDISGTVHGYVWLLQNPETCEMRYGYTEAETVALMAEGWDKTETIPWRLNGMYSTTVIRDRGWFRETAKLRQEFWENVTKAREGAFKVVEGRPKTVIVTKEPAACLIQDP